VFQVILDVLSQNILPIFLVAAVGFWLRRGMGLDKHVLSKLSFNALSPCLVFSLLVTTELPAGQLLQLALFAALSIGLMGLVGVVTGRLLKLSRLDTVALVIALMFVNGGNYGLTFNQLRYGDEGLARAIVYYATSTILLFTVGIVIASMGRKSGRETLGRLLRLPAAYAVLLALLVYGFSIPIPAPIMRSIQLIGAAALPVMLLVLGMQLADMDGWGNWRLAAPAVALRLIGGPLVALGVATGLGLNGLGRSVSIIEASMPTAVIVTILATEFDVQPSLMTTVVLLSTIFSLLTLPLMIALLGL
jgi:predicted permease